MQECGNLGARERLLEARRELAAQGKSTRGLGRERLLEACRWVYRWGWSAPAVLDGLGGTRRGLAKRAVDAGLLEETKTAAGGVLEDVPKKILTLTETGVAFVEKHLQENELLECDIGIKVPQDTLRHDFLVQKATLRNIKSGRIIGFQTPKELAEFAQKEEKIPDAVWIMPDNRRIAIELELTAKFKRRLDDFVWGVISALSGQNPRFDGCAIVSDSDAILSRYKAAFAPGKKIARWRRDSQSHWRIYEWREVPPWAAKKLLWLRLSQQ